LIFRKKKYKYNPQTLAFEEIENQGKQHVKVVLLSISICLITILLSGFVLNYTLISPQEFILEKKVSVDKIKLQNLWLKCQHYSTLLKMNYFAHDNLYRTILELDTIPLSIRNGGTGGSSEDFYFSLNSDISYQLEKQIDKLNFELKLQSNSFNNVFAKSLEYKNKLIHLPAIQPVSLNDLIMISSYFGMRPDPFNFEEKTHSGLDMVTSPGKNVYATGDGIVTLSEYSRTGYGNEVIIDHSFGFSTRYAHLEKFFLSVGEKVKRGQLIGLVGNTGRSTGPHLHYEVRYENKPVNPILYFDKNITLKDYNEIIKNGN
jgi:murein DD-endopeptidase MepM/ murein hydrolase activator NlpD